MENYYLKKTHKKTEKSGAGLDSCQAPGGRDRRLAPGCGRPTAAGSPAQAQQSQRAGHPRASGPRGP